MKTKKLNKSSNPNIFFLTLIILTWLVTYVVTQILLEQKPGWDEIAYLGVARGIEEDFDFSARIYTVMGLIKQGYPNHFINFPLFPVYLAGFFKLFGVSLKVAYFSSWLCALGVCILIYFIFLMLSENSYKTAFFVSLSYLFSPGILKTCDSAMMEQTGCLLISLAVYLILKDYVRNNFNYIAALKLAISFLMIWLFKSLFIGFFFGAFLFISLAYNPNFTGRKLNAKIPLFLFVSLSYGIFAILFFMLKKIVFLPVSPMMTFTRDIEIRQTYADFLGGFFNDFWQNLVTNVNSFFIFIFSPFFVYPTKFTDPENKFLIFIPHVVFLEVYFFLLLIVIVLTFALWKKILPQVRLFSILTLGTIFSFNLVFNFLFTTTFENIWRYNVYSFPLFLCYLGVILKQSFEYVQPFATQHPNAFKMLICMLFVFFYIPVFLSMLNIQLALWDIYHERARTNDRIVKSILKENKPDFIYLNDGTHTTFTLYPIRQVIKDATNDQLLAVNKILPKPIEFLFLRRSDWLYRNNKELISMGESILDDRYKLYGITDDREMVVYVYDKSFNAQSLSSSK